MRYNILIVIRRTHGLTRYRTATFMLAYINFSHEMSGLREPTYKESA